MGYEVAVLLSLSSIRNGVPLNQLPKIKSYSPESTILVIATLIASRSSPESSRTAIPKFSSSKMAIIVPSKERTGVSPNA